MQTPSRRSSRRLVALALAIAIAAGVAASSVVGAKGRVAEKPPRVSHLVLEEFVLGRRGLVVELHPTARSIRIEASTQKPLHVCQLGTTFAGAWRGGCRSLRRPLYLPATSGGLHVAFRVVSRTGEPARVRRLDLRWHCTDRTLWLRPTAPGRVAPRARFDC